MWLSECHNKSKVPVSKELITTPGEGLGMWCYSHICTDQAPFAGRCGQYIEYNASRLYIPE